MGARRSALTSIVALVAAAPTWAAATPPSAPPSPFGEEIDVRVVNVEVVVTDRQGQRVFGLAPEDFTLSVDGQPVPVGFFTEVRDGNTLPTPAAAAEQPAAESLRAVPAAAAGTHYLVFVDDYFAVASHRDVALHALQKELSLLRPADRMALVSFDGGRLNPLTGWTGSQADLASALDREMKRVPHGFDRLTTLRSFQREEELRALVIGDATPLDLATRSGDITGPEQEYSNELLAQIGASVGAASAAMRAFADAPGRKVMLLLAGSWPYSVNTLVTGGRGMPRSDIPEGDLVLEPLVDTANLLGYTIYPVDLPGLRYGGPDVEASQPELQGLALSAERQTEDSLLFLAEETGGRAVIDKARAVALSTAADDTRSFYWLGFVPSWKGDDRPHRINVTLRRPELTARSRTGFLDLSRQAETTMRLESALLLGSIPGALSMPMKLGEVKRAHRGVYEVPVTIGVPVDMMTVVPLDDQYAAKLEVRYAASNYEDGGSSADAGIPVVPLTLTSAKPPTAGGFVRHEMTVKLRGRADHLVVAVYDPLSDRMATAEADIALP